MTEDSDDLDNIICILGIIRLFKKKLTVIWNKNKDQIPFDVYT